MKEISKTGLQVLNRRYLKKDDTGAVIERPSDMFYRVAAAVAAAEEKYIPAAHANPLSTIQYWRDEFYKMMSNLDFLPNSPTLMNAGRPLGQLSACFVLPIEDTMEGIFGTLRDAALIHKSGGGTGFSFSRIRQAGARVSTTNGQASGPLSFMEAYNSATGTVAQGGCFVGETKVMTDHGPVQIKDLTAGTMVLSMDHAGNIIYTSCTDPFLTKRDVSVISVAIGEDDTVICTPDHPFMVDYKKGDNGGGEFIYKKAIELKPGDTVISHLYLVDKPDAKKRAVSPYNTPANIITHYRVRAVTMQHATRDVWNVEIPDTHNYAVCTSYGDNNDTEHDVYFCTFVSNTRRGANMGLLRVDHPDIVDFIKVKEDLTKLTNFNLSVGITAKFMEALKNHTTYDLVDPHTGEVVSSIDANEVWDMIIHSAWKCGEPGIIFLDRINESNFLKPLYGEIEGTNPCVVGTTPITIRLPDGTITERIIESLVDQEVEVWNGREWSKATPRVTGTNQPVMTIAFSNGRWIRCTPYHKFIMATGKRENAEALKVGDVLAPWKLPECPDDETGESVYVDMVSPVAYVADKVYCLTETKRHAFMANGVVVGNCGEQPLLPYEACNLGSINLANFVLNEEGPVSTRTVDYTRLNLVVRTAVRFLDDVIDVNNYPMPQIREMCLSTRKIGLGVMGFADMLHKLGIPYNSEEGFDLARSVMQLIQETSHQESYRLATERGAYPAYDKLVMLQREKGDSEEIPAIYRRNAMVTTIAPTGSISAIAGVSSGIEPLFANVFYKNVMDNDYLPVVNLELMKCLQEAGVLTPELEEKIKNSPTIAHMEEIPEHIRRVFVCAHDISPEAHIKMQSVFQKYTDNAISKTVNFNEDATEDDIRAVYEMAYAFGCKGVTVYRNNCRANQVLNLGTVENKDAKDAAAETPNEYTQLSYDLIKKVVELIIGPDTTYLKALIDDLGSVAIGNFLRGLTNDQHSVVDHLIVPKGARIVDIVELIRFVYPEVIQYIETNAAPNHSEVVSIRKVVTEAIGIVAANPNMCKILASSDSDKALVKDAYGNLGMALDGMTPGDRQVQRDSISQEHLHPDLIYRAICEFADKDDPIHKQPMPINDAVLQELHERLHEHDTRGVLAPTYPATALDSETAVAPIVRPEALDGRTKCVKINCGKLYVTTNHDQSGKPFEVFTTNGKGGGCPAQSEAVCRLASLLLRCGVDVKTISRQLRGIKCTACLKNPDIHVLSCPDAIGRELEAEYERIALRVDDARIAEIEAALAKEREMVIHAPVEVKTSALAGPPEMHHGSEKVHDELHVDGRAVCPQCGAEMLHEGGCMNCIKCGYSNCG